MSCEDAYQISYDLIHQSRQHLLLNDQIAIDVPIRLIHGMEDKDVPYQTSIRVAEKVTSNDVEVRLLKNSGHRLSSPEDFKIIYQTISELMR